MEILFNVLCENAYDDDTLAFCENNCSTTYQRYFLWDHCGDDTSSFLSQNASQKDREVLCEIYHFIYN